MLKNYIKIALRNLRKSKTFSFINIIGLSIGTLCCLYILFYVEDQYGYDKHHKDVDHIYRINTSLAFRSDKHNNASCSPPIAPAMKRDFAEVQEFTRLISNISKNKHLLRYKENSFYEDDVVIVDSTFFDVFTYHFTSGQKTNVLSEPYSLVLEKRTSDKLFGNEDPVGKIIEINNENGIHDYKVTGVIDESLGKSHIQANMFITMNSGGIGDYVLHNNTWAGNNFTYSYVKLNPKADAATLESKLPAFLQKYGADQLKQVGMTKRLSLQPVQSIHTTTGYEVELTKTISPSFLNVLLLIAFIIQLIACINFMNLSTMRASIRAKEVGVRKVIGAERKDLVRQFMSESFLLALTGVLIALPLLLLLLPYLNYLTQANIQTSFLTHHRTWILLGGITLLTGLIAGSYPALYLSAFQAIKVIKGNFANNISAGGIRRSLVVLQFALSIILITGIVVIYHQLHYIASKDLGFDANQKLIISFHTDESKKQMSAFSEDLRQLAEIQTVSRSNNYMSQFVPRDHGVYLRGGNMATATDVKEITTDQYFVEANGIEIMSGRNFHLHDQGKVLINETLMNRLGLDALTAPGTRLYTQYEPDPETFVEVAGVMKDFNYNSLHEEVRPLMLAYDPENGSISHLTIATNSDNYQSLLQQISVLWQKNLPEVPFEYSFLNEEVQKLYETEITLSRIINAFALVAILISCLGLFGLVTFSAERRNKEISVRKVLGSSVPGIVRLLLTDLFKLILIAFVLAAPVAAWVMNEWLQNFSYRIQVEWWVFVVAGMIAFLIALASVSFQALKAAFVNPVDSLRTE